MKFAHRKVMKIEAKLRRDVGVRILLMGQADVETDGFSSDVEGAAIGGLHDSRSATGHDDPVLPIGGPACRAHEATEFAGPLVVVALRKDTLGNCQTARQVLVAGVGRQCGLQPIHLTSCSRRLAGPRTSEDHDRLTNAVLFKQYFGLEIVDLQADAPHGVPRQEIEVDVGPAITGASEYCLDARGGVRVFVWRLWALPGKRLAPVHRMGGLWNPRLVRDWLVCFHRCAVPSENVVRKSICTIAGSSSHLFSF